MAPRVHLRWCALACAARSAAEPPPPADRGGFAINASRAANGVDDASAAEALAAVWETRVLATFKQ